MGKVTIKVHVVARRESASGRWLAGSPELDVWSSGDSPQDALNRAEEALVLFLDSATELGSVWDLLREAGVKVYATPDRVPPDSFLERVRNAVRGDSFPVQLTIPVPVEQQAAAL